MKTKLSALALFAVLSQPAHALFVLDFEGVGNNASINNFYNGGTDSQGHTGTNYGIQFGSNALGLIDADAGGYGNFANEPSPSTVMYFLSGSAVLNYAPGFDTGFSFFYTSAYAASVSIYDGLNASGNLLGTINLVAQNSNNCSGDPSGSYCNWTDIGASFGGTAMSIDFGGTANYVAFDNITFGSATAAVPVPEPATLALLGLGLAGMGFARRRKSA